MTQPTVTCFLADLSDLSTPLADLTETTSGWSWRSEINEAGTGSITFQNDDPALALVTLPTSVVLFYVDGVFAFALRLASYDALDFDDREEAAEQTTFTGPGLGGLADFIEIFPTGGVGHWPIQEDVKFDWTHPAYDDSDPGWVAATAVATVESAQTDWPNGGVAGFEWDAEFPDPATVDILWSDDGDDSNAPPGDRYIRQPYTLGTGGKHQVLATADNLGEFNNDGQLILTPGQEVNTNLSGWTKAATYVLDLGVGSHLMAVKVTNLEGASLNPAGQAWALYPQDSNGQLGTRAAASSAATALVWSGGEPPGVTPGWAIGLVCDEYEARAGMSLFDRSFDDVNDSNGNPWSLAVDISTKVFTKLGMFLRELSATYIDWSITLDVDTGRPVLNCWRIGESGVTPGVTYQRATDDETTGNLNFRKRSGEGPVASVLGIRWTGGWAARESAASIAAFGRIEDMLGLGPVGSIEESYRTADGQLEDFGAKREQTDIGIVPRTDPETPWVGYEPIGATIDLEGTDHRILAMTVNVNDDGEVAFNATLNDRVVLNPWERITQALSKMAGRGTVGGRAKPANPVVPVYIPRGFVDIVPPPPTVYFTTSTSGDLAPAATSFTFASGTSFVTGEPDAFSLVFLTMMVDSFTPPTLSHPEVDHFERLAFVGGPDGDGEGYVSYVYVPRGVGAASASAISVSAAGNINRVCWTILNGGNKTGDPDASFDRASSQHATEAVDGSGHTFQIASVFGGDDFPDQEGFVCLVAGFSTSPPSTITGDGVWATRTDGAIASAFSGVRIQHQVFWNRSAGDPAGLPADANVTVSPDFIVTHPLSMFWRTLAIVNS